MKNRIRFLAAGFSILVLILFLASCSNIIRTDSGEKNPSGQVSVSFNVTSSLMKNQSARTALPSVNFEKYLYEIKAKNLETEIEKTLAQNLEISDLQGQKFKLKRAKWIFYILAYNKTADGKAEQNSVFEGESEEIDLENSAVATVTMPLHASTEGTGSVKIPLKYNSKGVKKVTCGLYPTATGGELLDGKTLQIYPDESSGNIITENNGVYSLVFEDDSIPSGKTIYARFTLYDENDVEVGYYTEAIYVVSGEQSKPEIFIKNEDGSIQKDASGNPVKDETEAASVEIEPNLFPAAVTAEKDKKVYAETTVKDENGNEKKIVYELYDEDGDGVYDTVLPPGDYEIKVGESDGTVETAEKIEDANLDVGTKGGNGNALKLKTVTIAASSADGKIKVGVTLTATASSKGGTDISDQVSWKWYYTESDNDSDTTEWKEIEGAAENSYKLTSQIQGKIIKVEATQNFNNGKVVKFAKTAAQIENGSIVPDSYIIEFDGTKYKVSKDGTAVADGAGKTVIKGTDEAIITAEKITITELKDDCQNEISATSVFTDKDGAEFTKKTLESSELITIKVKADGYNPVTANLYITVKFPLPSISLSTKTDEITYGKVAFSVPEGTEDTGAEYSVDGGKNWLPVTSKAFVPPADKKILIRTKTVGEEGKNGYIAQSENKEITVTDDNIGKKNRNFAPDGFIVSYPEPVVSGNAPDGTKLNVTGTLKDTEETVIPASTDDGKDGGYTISIPSDTITKSGEVTVTIKAIGYNDITQTVFVTVKAKTPQENELPALSKDSKNIEVGALKFDVKDDQKDKFEYSTDGGTTWKKLDDKEFEQPAAPNELLVRTAPAGKEGESGYVGASDPVKVKIEQENIGNLPKLEAKITPAEPKYGEKLTVTVKDPDGNSATDTLKYEWYKADSKDAADDAWEKLDVTANEYKPALNDIGKYFRVKVDSVEGNNPRKTLTAELTSPVANGTLDTSGLTFTYPQIVTGSVPVVTELNISGSLKDSAGTVIPASVSSGDGGYTIAVQSEALTKSGEISVLVTVPGYETATKKVYVSVKAKTPSQQEIPSLSKDVMAITGGKVKFDVTDEQKDKFEYSTDGGTTWKTVDDKEFELPVAPNELIVRTKPEGTEGQPGYVAPSESVKVTYTESEVLGKKPVVKITINLGGDITVTKSGDDSDLTADTVLTAAEGYSSYTWLVDGKPITNAWAVVSGTAGNVLTIKKSDESLVKGSYTITVVGKKNNVDYSTSISVSVIK